MHATRREILLVCAAALLAVAAIGVRTAEAATAGAGSVLAFGANASGQLGRPANATPNPTPTVVEIPGQVGPVTQLTLHFEGRINRHLRLAPGTYDVAVRATNAQGMASGVRALGLVVSG